LKDINPGSGGSGNGFHTGEIVVSGSYLFFTAYTDATGTELWRSDGTAEGTILLKDIDQGNNPDDIVPAQLTDVNGTLFFTDGDEFTGTELWKSNGTAAGTLLVKDIIPGNDQNSPKYLTNVNGTLFFNSGDPASINSLELWKSDGSANGTVLVKLITPAGPDPQSLKAVNGLLYFSANDGTFGRELWISDGSVCGTQRLTDIYPGAGSSNPYVINVLNNEILFAATQPDIGSEYWKIAASGIPSPLKTFVPFPAFCPGDASSVTFDFSCNVNAGNVYTVQLSNASGNFSNPLTIGSLASQNASGSIPIQIPNAASGSHFRIRTVASDPAVTGADNGNDLVISCPPPANFQVTTVNSSSATLSWNDVSCAEKFQLRYRITGTLSWLKVNTSGTTKTISNLQANTNYEVQVHSKCATGPDVFSAFTPSLFFTTQPLKESPGEESMLLSDFKIYPNPATAIVTVTLLLPADAYAKIILSDVQGRSIRSIAEGNFVAGSYSLDLNDLPAGIYFVECRTNSIVQSKKLVVQ
jgi:ELWxxDGT repeat protein